MLCSVAGDPIACDSRLLRTGARPPLFTAGVMWSTMTSPTLRRERSVARFGIVSFLLVASVLLLPSTVYPAGAECPVKVGLELGLNRATFSHASSRPGGELNPLLRLRGGVTLSFMRNRASSVESGLMFEMMGGRWHSYFAPSGEGDLEFGFDRTLRTTYLAVPLLLRVYVAGPPVRPFVNVGFETGALLAAAEDTRHAQRGERVRSGRNARSLLSSFPLDGVVGAGVLFPLRGRSFLLGLSYLYGLKQVDDNRMKTEGDLPTLNSRCVRITLGTILPC
jgi:hypothetical protein